MAKTKKKVCGKIAKMRPKIAKMAKTKNLLVSDCSNIHLKLNLMDDDNEMPCPTLEKNAMSY